MVIERTIVVLAKKLPKADWKRYQAFSKNILVSRASRLLTRYVRSRINSWNHATIARGKPRPRNPPNRRKW